MRSLLLLMALVPSFLHAQQEKKINLGIKAGLNLANSQYKAHDNKENMGSRTSFHAGAFASIKVGKIFSVCPELLYSGEGYLQNKDGRKIGLELTYINLPVQFRYNHSSGIFAETGPQAGLLLKAKSTFKSDLGENETDVKDKYEGINLSWDAGIGFRYKKFGVGIRYALGLQNIFKAGRDEYFYKTRTLQMGVSYSLR